MSHLVEPWGTPRGTLPQGRPGPRSLSGLRPQSFQLLGEKNTPPPKTSIPQRIWACMLSPRSPDQNLTYYPKGNPTGPLVYVSLVFFPLQKSPDKSPSPESHSKHPTGNPPLAEDVSLFPHSLTSTTKTKTSAGYLSSHKPIP